jgi:4-hydroxybenzoate polyprenyltransferase
MRSFGCVVNDIADRHIDKHVSRTKFRPLTTGEVSLSASLCLLLLLLIGALLLLLFLPKACFYWALGSVLITVVYPYTKRFINTPQMVLGFAFSMGIPMAYVASGVPFSSQVVLLCLINFLWIVAYDTMYAMVDKADDLKIGVKSTAIYFGSYDSLIIGLMQALMHVLWLFWAISSNASWSFYIVWCLGASVLMYQQQLIKAQVPQDCFRSFLMSSYYGALMWLGLFMTHSFL